MVQMISLQKRGFCSTNCMMKTASQPELNIRWFYATDVPASKPEWMGYTKEKEPKKFIPFSESDSYNLEKKYQKNKESESELSRFVEVNEDKLFQVDLEKKELQPVYWDGPAFEVRRGKWFHSNGIPIEDKLASLLEDGYQRIMPYKLEKENTKDRITKDIIKRFNQETSRGEIKEEEIVDKNKLDDLIDLGDGNSVMYFDEKHAAIFPSTMASEFQLGVIRSFGPGASTLVSVNQIQRGYSKDLAESIFDNFLSNPIPDSFKKEKASPEIDSTSEDSRHQAQIENDYKLQTKESDSNREIDHVILCIHGIGQILGTKYESVNFTHSINVLRNTMRDVFVEDKKYRNLVPNNEKDKDSKNNRIQVLPISWRHKVDFHPQKRFEVYDKDGNYALPTLAQINVDGVKPLRNIFGDVVLDVLLYYEPHYLEQITKLVTGELNRVYKLYMERNPDYKGKFHVMGHSLGSAIAFDILASEGSKKHNLEFDVENLYCVGSPVGVFKLLKQMNIVARDNVPEDFDPSDTRISSPKCKNLYNIFHPCDPVGYRMEPLISPRFSNLKPENVPFAIKGINTQIKELADFGDEISEKIAKASSWFKSSLKEPEPAMGNPDKENVLGEIITSLFSKNKSDSKNEKKYKKEDLGKEDLDELIAINRTGRVDYCLPMGIFDISLISAISAHISYFEDKDTAGFIMQQTLQSHKDPVDSREVTLYK